MKLYLLSNVDWVFSSIRPFDGAFYAVAELRDGEWVCLRWRQEGVVLNKDEITI